MSTSSEKGFSLIEVMFAVGILTAGVLGAAAVMSTDMQQLGGSPTDVIMIQKAEQALECVFAARDSQLLTWAQIQNIGNGGGVFLSQSEPLYLPGPDGLVNTNDDIQTIETYALPGKDGIIGTADDQQEVLVNYTRQITITNVPNENGNLRAVTVTITYQSGTTKKTYVLYSLISAYV